MEVDKIEAFNYMLHPFSVKYRSIEPREGAEPYNAKRYNDKFYHRVRNAVNDLKKKNE